MPKPAAKPDWTRKFRGRVQAFRGRLSGYQGDNRYSLEGFGQARADRYVADLEACLTLLANSPLMGREFGQIRANLRRHEHQSHVVYYRKDGATS